MAFQVDAHRFSAGEGLPLAPLQQQGPIQNLAPTPVKSP
jgi:hypothetical protein